MRLRHLLTVCCTLSALVAFGQTIVKPHLEQFQQSTTPVQVEKLKPMKSPKAAAPLAAPNIFDYNLKNFTGLGTLQAPEPIPSFLIRTDAKTGLPIHIKGTLPEANGKLEEQALEYMATLQSRLQIKDAFAEFELVEKKQSKSGRTHLRLQQSYRGVKVYGAEVTLHASDGKIDLFTGRYYPTPDLKSIVPAVSKEEAVQTALLHVGKQTNVRQITQAELRLMAGKQAEAELVVYHQNRHTDAERLAWAITLRPNVAHQWAYFVDAETGAILHQFNEICRLHHDHFEAADATAPLPPVTATARDLFNINRTFNVWRENDTLFLIDATRPMFNPARSNMPDEPNGVIWTIDGLNTSPVNDDFIADHIRSTNNQWEIATAVSAHYNAGKAFEYFAETFDRNSINGQGGNIVSLINISEEDGSGMDNAFWNGAAMFYGNGNVAFDPLARGLDVAGHEMTHGVIQNEANLEYQNESGALNESFADVFGAMIDREDWQIGEDVVRTQFFPSGALRDMADPNNGGTSLSDNGWQPANVSEQFRGSEDNGGVHINSGIPNRAFYLFATAVGRDVAEQVYYDVLSNYLVRSSQFIDMRLAVIEASLQEYGQSVANEAVTAFDMVGIVDGQGGGEVPTDVSVNAGDEFILYSNGNQTKLSIALPDGSSFTDPLTTIGPLSKPSITDDGSVIVYVARDQTLQAIIIDWNMLSATQQTLSGDQVWRNAVISKDGNRLAAITNDFDNRIFVFDLTTNSTNVQEFKLFNPTFTEGVSTGDVLYADAMEFDFSGEFLMYDALNNINNTFGDDIEYWDIGFLRVWDNALNNFGTGTIEKLFTGIPEGISIGNPVFSKNSPFIVAFDYVDFFEESYLVLGANIQTGDIGEIWSNVDLSFPSYATDDSRMIFDGLDLADNRIVAITDLMPDKINGTGSANVLLQGDFSGARWGVWFANGQRVLTSNEIVDDFAQNLDIFPNPFQEIIYLRGASATSGILRVEVFDQFGRRIQGENFSVGNGTWQESLSLEKLPMGTYIIRVSAGESSTSRKILKAR